MMIMLDRCTVLTYFMKCADDVLKLIYDVLINHLNIHCRTSQTLHPKAKPKYSHIHQDSQLVINI